MDIVLTRLVTASGNDAAFMRAGADDERAPTPFGMNRNLDGCEERIHIDMQYRSHLVDYIIFRRYLIQYQCDKHILS